MNCYFLLIFLLVWWPLSILHAEEARLQIQSIDIRGNKNIKASVIKDKLTVKPGDPFSPDRIRDQIQLIYAMGFFKDVQVETDTRPEGVHLVFLVQEKPFNVEVVLDGYDKLNEDKLQEKITIGSQVWLDQEQVKVSTENIRQAYKEEGYFNAKVVPVIETIESDRTRLTFFIQEGERSYIKAILFDGRTVIKKKELQAIMANREYAIPWSWFTDAGVFRQDEVPNDVQRIVEVYSNKGYLDVKVGTPSIDLSEDKKWFTLTFSIVEGEPYTVSQVSFDGNEELTSDELELDLNIEPGEVFQRVKIREEVTRVTDLYGEKGYAFAEVVPKILPDPKSRSTEIVFKIEEGELIRIREIRISGNDKTRDNVIRREVRVDEREMIDSVAIKRSFERLNNLNYFESVEILPKQIDEGQVDLDVKVKEKATGSFSVGGGFSTLDLFTAIADITEGNLFGLGYLVRVRGQLGGRRTVGNLTFRNPAIYDTPTSMQLDAFSTRTNFLTFVEDRVGGNAVFGRSFSEFLSGSITFVGEQIRIKDPAPDAPESILEQVGTQSTTGFRASGFRDTRDYFLDPRTGSRVGLRLSLGTDALGGTNNFISYSLDALRYIPVPLWDLRFAFRARIGQGEGFKGSPLPVSEFFFVGGINTVRGFQFGRAGPVTSSGTAEGGTAQLIFNNELIFPVLPDAKLNGVLFFDYGKGFAEDESLSFDLRPATGIEVRWISPFGPLRAAYGLNLDRTPQERETVFEFSVGSVF
ncbi:MAG: outer membrane protein assembly factor BamA [Nitrospirota bacterium]|nr:MAG: outer membrane protein assembly factor BamA [Nitrospirota bacterium]